VGVGTNESKFTEKKKEELADSKIAPLGDYPLSKDETELVPPSPC
jgi:hypothetical protein